MSRDSQPRSPVVGYEIEQLTLHGDEPGGFLQIHRNRLRTRRADGSMSASFVCDFVGRPMGADAVVVALYHRPRPGSVDVLLRRGVRPAVILGRPAERLAMPEERTDPYLTEVVAGVVEAEDRGVEGLRRRAAAEAWEEAGFRVPPQSVRFLGAGTFPSPGSMPEKFWFMAVEIADPSVQARPAGDGSVMEESSATHWRALDEAIEDCVEGRIEDAKTELVLRRLRDQLRGDPG